jgi:hypothetical protein
MCAASVIPALSVINQNPAAAPQIMPLRYFTMRSKAKNTSVFYQEDTYLPMMYMPDAIRATLELMDAPAEK